MTVRQAELLMTLVLGVFSAYLMYKSAELPIGWIPSEGPGGGAFPFWLGAGMLGCCVLTLFRWFARKTPESRSEEPYLEPRHRGFIIAVTISLTVMIGAVHVIGMYFAIPLFLIYYIRFLGRHSWPLTLSIAILTPVITFFFFEIALRIILPKGYTEPLFYPLYDIFL
ncbi:MAG: tripartite tricarboxylate transporter TctB family protein [Gammaproteobacteria bacterium]